MSGELTVIRPDCWHEPVPNTYEGIKAAMGGATIDLIRGAEFSLFIDDEAMLNGSVLNVVASLMTGIALFGPVVVCALDPDAEGDSLPASPEVVEAFTSMADQWGRVLNDARRTGQDLTVVANAATVPGPTFIALSGAAFEEYLTTGRLPDDLTE